MPQALCSVLLLIRCCLIGSISGANGESTVGSQRGGPPDQPNWVIFEGKPTAWISNFENKPHIYCIRLYIRRSNVTLDERTLLFWSFTSTHSLCDNVSTSCWGVYIDSLEGTLKPFMALLMMSVRAVTVHIYVESNAESRQSLDWRFVQHPAISHEDDLLRRLCSHWRYRTCKEARGLCEAATLLPQAFQNCREENRIAYRYT